MRVLVVTPTYLDEDDIVGGAEQFVHSISKELVARPEVSNLEVNFFSPSKNSKTIQDGVTRYGQKAIYLRANPSNPLPVWTNLFYIKYDVLYLHQFNTWITLFYSLVAKLLGKRVILTDHNGGGINYNRRLKVQNLIDINFHTSNISKTDTSFNIKKNIRIFGGVDTDIYKESTNVERNRDFLFVGRLHPVKGIDLLIQASKDCKKPHSLTLVLGNHDHQRREELENEVRGCNQIKILWNLNRDELIREYSSHRWTLLPSKNVTGRENLGLTILEGMSCNTMAACSPHCGVSEMKDEHPTSFLHVTEDWLQFFEDNTGPVSYERGARDWVLENGTWSSVADRLIKGLLN